MENKHIEQIAEEFNFTKQQVKAVVLLLDKGNTVPFIARYRKERTGGLDGKEIREIEEKQSYLNKLRERKEKVIKSIAEQDELTAELEKKIRSASLLQEVEDFYRPYKKKRKTRASKARQKGLEPLAKKIWTQEKTGEDLEVIAQKFLDSEKNLETTEDVLLGARDIIAEWISDEAKIRKKLREIFLKQGQIYSQKTDDVVDEKNKFRMYYDYKEKISRIPAHRTLAINRGEKEEILKVKIIVPQKNIISRIKNWIISDPAIFYKQLEMAINDSYKRLIFPSISRQVRKNLTQKAEEQAREVFKSNLRSLLLQPPVRKKVVMGIDPGFKSGCKVCVVDKYGKLQAEEVIYPHPPQKKKQQAEKVVRRMIADQGVETISVGNGTASRNTELFLADLINKEGLTVNFTIVNEAGASVYSASEIGRKEFPDLDTGMRGAVSIARRLQDPLAELVKINPRHLGVGLYQHDLDERKLESSLEKVVIDVVNFVGVDLNTASESLLQYVSGINSNTAHKIIEYREKNDGFSARKELKDVYGVGPKTFTQAAGFLKLYSSQDPLAATPIHPEAYQNTEQLLAELGFTSADILKEEKLQELRVKLEGIDISDKAETLGLGIPTLNDIIKALKKPGRDPRQEKEKPIFRKDVLQLEDLKPEMVLKGRVSNVVDFGAFVDIGVKQDGLVHISEMSDEYIKHPLDMVQNGQIISVKVLEIDQERERISLSMKL
ncbi:MAG: Tex family protein [Bacillota bacterium]